MKTLFKNAIFKALLQICNIVIPVVIGMIVLRILNRALYDEYSSVDSFFQFFLIAGAFGIYNYGVREASKVKGDKEKSNQLFTQLFTFSSITNIIAIGAYIVFAVCMYQGEANHLKLVLSFVVLSQFLGNIFNVEWLNEADENYVFISLKSIAVRIIYLVLAILLVKEPEDVVIYVGILSGTAALNMIISFIYIIRKYKFDFRNFNLKKHIIPAISIFLIANVMLLYSQFNKAALSTMATNGIIKESEVTAYTLGQHISYMIYSVVISLGTIAIPRLTNMLSNNKKEEAYKLHSNILNILMLIMIPTITGVCLLSGQIVVLYGGGKYVDAALPLTLYALVQLISSVHYMYGEALIYIVGKEKRLLVHNIIGAGCNVIPALICCFCGVYNAVIATVILIVAYAIIGVLDLIYIKRKLNYQYSIFNKHTLVYVFGSALFIPIILLTKDFFYGLTGPISQYMDIIFSIIMIVVCALLYFIIILVFEIKIFKNKYLIEKLTNLKSKFKKKEKSDEKA